MNYSLAESGKLDSDPKLFVTMEVLVDYVTSADDTIDNPDAHAKELMQTLYPNGQLLRLADENCFVVDEV
jgi:hypothetical protein